MKTYLTVAFFVAIIWAPPILVAIAAGICLR